MTLEIILIIVGGAFFVLAIVLFITLRKTTRSIQDIKQDQADNKVMTVLQQQMGQLTSNLNSQLQGINSQFLQISSQFQKTTGHIGTTLGDVKKDMGRMETVTREVLEKAKNISNLENLLRAPKFRGGLGELFLGDLLSQILPPAHFQMQYKFKSGEIVDAIVRIGSNIVPIDSKFPLEDFKRYVAEEEDKERLEHKKKFVTAVKKHVTSISDKYILPDEETYDFALMYIPAENIYYETILKDEKLGEDRGLLSYCTQKRVIPVSPNSFFAYLQVIVLGLKGLQIEKSAKEIYQSLTRLQRDLGRFKKDFEVMGSHLVNAKTKYDDADKRLDKFTGKLELLGSESPTPLPESTEEPSDL
ncbi:DNA recombination protein RmuC [Acidobacteriota bacterium]